MNMPMFNLGNKQTDQTPAQGVPASGIPTEQVMAMRQQGLNNNQIIQNLQGQGFKSNQVFDAMNQADISGNMNQPYPQAVPQDASISPPDPAVYPPPEQLDQPPPPDQMAPPPVDMGMPPSEPPPVQLDPNSEQIKDRIEELTEAIIDEKWKDIQRDINKIIDWKEKSESRLTKVEQDMKNMKDTFESLHKGVLGKISEYDQNITNVGVEIKAMEKVFQKILPTFTENVNKLSMVTKNITKKSK
jgi:transcription termination factor NusB